MKYFLKMVFPYIMVELYLKSKLEAKYKMETADGITYDA